jgi:hypothetical protein
MAATKSEAQQPLDVDGIDESDDFGALQAALQNVIQSKRGKSVKKQQEILAAVQKGLLSTIYYLLSDLTI